MATVSQWTPFGVALNITATGGTVVRTSATQFTVKINASWEVYWSGAQTNYGMTASAGGGSVNLNTFGTKASKGSGSFTGTFSISGNGSATKTITVTFKNYNTDNGNSATKTVSFSVSVPAWTYTVSFNANGGSGAPSSQTKYYGKTLTLSSTKPTKTGYTFLGWSTSSSATSATYSAGGSYTANASVTLYAVWKVNTLTIKYHINGGTLNSDTYYSSSSLIYLTSSSSVLQDSWTYNSAHTYGLYNASTFGLTRTGYTFKGWKVGSSGTTVFDQDDATIVPTDLTSNIKTGSCTITLYAVWELISYTVTFNANGGSGAPSSQTKYYGQTLVLSSTKPTRSGYTFMGWGTSASDTTADYSAGGNYTSNSAITLYAVWKKTITLTYNANGGSGAPSSSSVDVYNSTTNTTFTISSAIPTRTGYTFLGWGTSSTSTSATYSAGDSLTLSTSTTLYAVWKINSYKLTVNPNGGTWKGTTNASAVTQNYGTTLSIEDPTWVGHTFQGWILSGSGKLSGTTYTFGAGAGTLTARWDTNDYVVTLDAGTNGGSVGGASQSPVVVEYGTAIGELPIAIKKNYIFLGWFTSAIGGTQITSSYVVTGDITFYAQFEIDASAYVNEDLTWEAGVTYITDSNGNVKKGHAKVNDNGVWKDGFCT